MDVPTFATRLRTVDVRFQRQAALLHRAATHGPLIRRVLLASAGQAARATAWWLTQPLAVALCTWDDPLTGACRCHIADPAGTQSPITVDLAGDTPGWQAVNLLMAAAREAR